MPQNIGMPGEREDVTVSMCMFHVTVFTKCEYANTHKHKHSLCRRGFNKHTHTQADKSRGRAHTVYKIYMRKVLFYLMSVRENIKKVFRSCALFVDSSSRVYVCVCSVCAYANARMFAGVYECVRGLQIRKLALDTTQCGLCCCC